MSAKTAVGWKKYTPKMKRLANRREKLLKAIADAGVWLSGRKIEKALLGLDWYAVTSDGQTSYHLTYKGLLELARRTGVKVPR